MLHSDVFLAFLFTSIALAIVSTLLARLRIPTIVGFIITGMIIGPSGLNWIKSLPAAQSISEIGIVLLMFSLGLEISLVNLKKMLKPLVSLGLAQVLGTMFVSMIFFTYFLGFDTGKAFVFGSCLALSSTAVVLKLLHEKRETETPYGRVSVIVLLFQDIVSLPLMAVIPLLASTTVTSQNTQSLLMALTLVLAFILVCFIVGYYVIPILFHEVTKANSREVFFFSVMSITFVIAYLAELVGLSMSIGAFLAGVLISESSVSKQALAEMSPFRDIFLGFFFASVGMMIDLKFVYLNLHHLIWLIPTVVVIKFAVLYVVVKRNSYTHGISFVSALALTQIGEFSFIIAASAHNHNIISIQEFQYFLALAISSLLFTPVMFYFGQRGSTHKNWPELAKSIHTQFRFYDSLQNEKSLLENLETETKINTEAVVNPRKAIVIGLGYAGKKAIEGFMKNGIPCVGVDINIENVKKIQAIGCEAVYGDSTSREVLDSVGVREAFLVIITISGRYMTAKTLATIKQLNPNIKSLVRVNYLRELEEIEEVDIKDIVVSEAVTTQEIINRALSWYGLQDNKA